MCEICKNTVNRDYTHSKNKHHRKLLYKIMKIKKNTNFYLIAYEEQAGIPPDIV